MQNDLITLAQAAKLLPTNNGKRICVSTLFRWATRGVHGVRLEVRRFGRRIYTTTDALDAFGKALAERPAPLPDHHHHSGRTPGQRERALADAAKTLEQAGI